VATGSVCGHTTETKGIVEIHGKKRGIEISAKPELCIECIRSMAIVCPRCKKLILVGDVVGVLIYTDNMEIPEGGKQTSTGHITCRNCTNEPAALAGHWMPPGKLEEFQL
jgi:hypothetical protein